MKYARAALGAGRSRPCPPWPRRPNWTVPAWPCCGVCRSRASCCRLRSCRSAPILWHHHFGKVAAAWGLAFLLPFAITFGPGVAGREPGACAAGRVHPVRDPADRAVYCGGWHLHPWQPTWQHRGSTRAILAIGAVLASFMGTTGRVHAAHSPADPRQRQPASMWPVVVFSLHRCRMPGGSLTPLGDPPLFLGFLKGVDFFWTVRHIFPKPCSSSARCWPIFFVLDSWYYHRREDLLETDRHAR